MPMNCALPQSNSRQNVRLVPVDPEVKSAKTIQKSNSGVSEIAGSAKSADPTCYNSSRSMKTGLFDMERMMIAMANGDVIRFKTTGYEVADVRNPNPPKEWTGYVIGGPNETHVVLWCERERREAGAILVPLENVVAKEIRA
jgi:hypothetical protein